MLRPFKIKTGDQFRDVVFERYHNLSRLDEETKSFLSLEAKSIIMDGWGKFGDEFIDRHVMTGAEMVLAKVDNEYVGLGVSSYKRILNKDVCYLEFLAVKKRFQGAKLGSRMSYLLIRDCVVKNFLHLFYQPLEVMLITPNIRVLMHMARFASFCYPNPYLADENGKIKEADELTWSMAQELIRQSENPSRQLDREGLVLYGSYQETPWLIYGPGNAPWVNDSKILKFVERYMDYHRGEDKEFVVRARITLFSLIRYFCHNFLFR